MFLLVKSMMIVAFQFPTHLGDTYMRLMAMYMRLMATKRHLSMERKGRRRKEKLRRKVYLSYLVVAIFAQNRPDIFTYSYLIIYQ